MKKEKGTNKYGQEESEKKNKQKRKMKIKILKKTIR